MFELLLRKFKDVTLEPRCRSRSWRLVVLSIPFYRNNARGPPPSYPLRPSNIIITTRHNPRVVLSSRLELTVWTVISVNGPSQVPLPAETIESDNIIEHSSYYAQRFLLVRERYTYYYLLFTIICVCFVG